jgi:hypothetical protein
MPDNNNRNNIIFSSVATAVAEFTTLPVCTIKTNYQNTNSISIISTTKDVYNRSGIRGFYAASFPAIAGQIFSTASKYTIYRYLDTQNDYPIKNKFLNGMTAGIISSLVTHPLDVIKIHVQMSTPFNNEIKKYGFGIFYRGYSKTFVKIAISSSLFFPLYDYFKEKIINPVFSAALSAGLTTVCMHPVDYLKTRHMAGLKLYNGINPLNYYKGLTLNLMRIVPHFIITMNMIEILEKNFKSRS